MERVDLDWQNLGFGLIPTDYNVVCRYRDGSWSAPEARTTHELTLPLGATALHYGQALFEGLKAYQARDGRVLLFRPEENSARMSRGARKLLMPSLSEEMFLQVVKQVVSLNERYIPPAGSGASLYIRPLLIGSGGRLGVRPAEEYIFCVFVTPVGPYFNGELTPIRLAVEEEVHRAAPLGVGDIKAAGNYAAGMRAVARAKSQGYDNVLYLDARESRYIDETGATNFYGILAGTDGPATYVTPRSLSILPSITNNSLMTLARDLGMRVEQRPVEVSEISRFSEAGCVGTAAVITPVRSIHWGGDKCVDYGDKPGPWTRKLYDALTATQCGETEDKHGWCVEV